MINSKAFKHRSKVGVAFMKSKNGTLEVYLKDHTVYEKQGDWYKYAGEWR